MDPVPYEIRAEDVDEVLSAYESASGGDWTDDTRNAARRHVMSRVTDIDEIVRSAPEDARDALSSRGRHAHPESMRPGEQSEARRELALAAIEDLLIRDGFIDVTDDEGRVFPAMTARDNERADG